MSVSNAKKQSNSIYYNIDIYNDNSTNGDISSKYSTAFNSPLLMDTSNYEVACVRARIPLDNVPLSQKNIPFEQYSVEIGIPVLGQPAHTYTYYSEYVPQFNALSTYENKFTIGVDGQNLFTSSLPVNEPTNNPTLTLTPKVPVIPGPVGLKPIDTGSPNTVFGLSYTALCIDDHHISRYVTATNVLVDTIDIRTRFNVLNAVLLGICMPTNTNDVYAVFYDGGDHFLCNASYTLGNQLNLILGLTGDEINLFSFTCSDALISLSYIHQQAQTYYNRNFTIGVPPILDQPGTIQPLSVFSNVNNIKRTYIDSNQQYFVGISTADNCHLVNINTNDHLIRYSWVSIPELFFERFLGTDAYGNLLISTKTGPVPQQYTILAFGKQSALLKYRINMGLNRPLVISNMISVPTGIFVNNPLPYAVQTINEYVQQINLAFLAIMAKIPTPPSSPQITPYLEFDSATRLVSIICDSGCWSGTNPAGINPPCVINFNQLLWSFFKFNSIAAIYTALPSIGGQVRTLQINKAIPPSALSISPQPSSTIYRFADITRIIIGTSKMSVYGDNQNNDKLLVNLSDFTIDTENGIPSLIIFNPVILRFYKLYQQTPLQQLDVFVSYADRAGDVFPITITPYNSIGLKLEFHRIPLVETI